MDDPPPLSHPFLAPRGRLLFPVPDRDRYTPARPRNTDDLLSSLTPRTIVEAIHNPPSDLKAAIDAASPTEQAFATKVAIAAQNFEDWLEELSAWPWPSGGGSAGFEMPLSKRRRPASSERPSTPDILGADESLSTDKLYCGSLLATEVARYEKRIDEIAQQMEELDVEEIKTQVLHNHIMPLSRPGSPVVDSNRSISSTLSSYARMDDLTALVTATIVQALPTLSKLTKLMNYWSFRLAVLRKIPVFLTSVADAEVALRSGWNAIQGSPDPPHNGSPTQASPQPSRAGAAALSRKEFDVMKTVLGRKVAKTGRDLDAMLDILEGWEDTLPDAWIDRVDALERDYSEWTVACEKKIRETDMNTTATAHEFPVTPAVSLHTSVAGSGNEAQDIHTTDRSNNTSQTDGVPPSTPPSTISPRETTPVIKVHLAPDNTDDASDRRSSFSSIHDSSDEGAVKTVYPKRATAGIFDESDEEEVRSDSSSHFDFDSDGNLEVERVEPELPTLPRSRRGSDMSTCTIVHGLQNGCDEFSSQLEQGTPELPRLRDVDLRGIPSDDLSPPSSPPAFRSSIRSQSMSFNDMPTVTELPDDESLPRTPLDSSMLEDDSSHSLGKAQTVDADDQFQQQISEILESVPAKIRLTSEPAATNLNPPDFKMPTAAPTMTTRKSSRPEYHNLRSVSSVSTFSTTSRAVTPSFTLAPAFARNQRARPQRATASHREIRVYNLSRSDSDTPIKLFIRCVGERGERVMVRVGGGWADLGEYLKEYASHHGRRSTVGGESKVEVKDLPRVPTGRSAATTTAVNSSPVSRPSSAQDSHISPLKIRKTRRTTVADEGEHGSASMPKTPLAAFNKVGSVDDSQTPSSSVSNRSRSSSRLSWTEEDSSLGMAGPKAKQIEMSEESKAWVAKVGAKVKEKAREVSIGDRTPAFESIAPPSSAAAAAAALVDGGKFGEIGKVGATKRLFRRQA